MLFATNNTERLRIDTNGYLGLHITDPHLYYSKTLVVGAETEGDGGGITIKGSSSHTNYLMFADSNSGAARYDGYVGYSHGNQKLYLATAGSPRADIDSSGNLSITNGNLVIGTSGKGIDFSATSDASGMDNELLDDYEEGDWTPVIASGSGSLSVHKATYTKIGRSVLIQFYFSISGTGSNNNNAIFTGLPFTVQSNGWTAAQLNTGLSSDGIHCRAQQSSSQIDIKTTADNAITFAQLNSTWILSGIHYFTDS